MKTKSVVGTWWRQFQGNALFVYFRLATLTSRWRFEGEENLAEAKGSSRPLLWAFWHQQTMAFMNYADKFEDRSTFEVVAVGDDRFDVLNSMGNRLGVAGTHAVDMKGNPVAAGRAVLHVINALKRGHQSVIAPDGPDGPPFQPKKGISVLARKAAAVILPVGVWTRQAYQLRRWDRYLVPFPFAPFHIVFGKPIPVQPETDTKLLLATVTEALNQVRTRAQILSGIKPWP